MSTIVKKGKIMAENIDSYVVSVENTITMDNGSQVVLGAPVANSFGLYNVAAPTDVTTQDVYMVLSQLVPKLVVNGVEYRIDITDPQSFTNVPNFPALAVKVAVGDEYTITTPGFTVAPTIGLYVVPVNGSLLLAPAADLTGLTTIAYLVMADEPISVSAGYVDAFRLRCIKSV
jgi:hypothetical protein